MDIKTLNEVVQSIITSIHDTLPDVDTKEGTFVRDVFIDPISDEISALYVDMKLIQLSQSVLTATGNDLDNLAGNYFVYRKQATNSYGKIRFYIKNTNITNVTDDQLPNEILIPQGTIISTLSSLTKDALQFQTTESAYADINKIKLLSVDSSTGYKFLEVAAQSISTGSIYNVGAGEIIQQVSNISSDIVFISNPFAFTGGTNYENDTSLALRVNLAISGSNVGTKDGYLSYILKQDGVADAKIIGAGDNIMFRDGGYINDSGNYVLGKGGMVDIYIRGQLNEETNDTFVVTTDYIQGSNPYKDIVLLTQPINNIISIISETTGKVYVDANNYEIEKGMYQDSNGNNITDIKYYDDILWDFTVTDSFPDEEYYPLPSDLNPTQIELLKQQVDAELEQAVLYMSNIYYGLNWSLMETRNNSSGHTTLFEKYFYSDNQVYKIIATDSRLNGRTFVKKNDLIYVRVYGQPDFVLAKDYTPQAGSIKASDSIHWLNGNRPGENETLTITYNYDGLINNLQSGIENVRILTADVLVKQSIKIPIEIILTATCYSNYNPTTVKTAIINRITMYVNNIKKLGGSFDRSDIVAVARETDGVDAVDIDTISISVVGNSPQKLISANGNEYLEIENIIVNVYSNAGITI